MFVLRGYCQKDGNLSQNKPIYYNFYLETNSCPNCGSLDTCDVHLEEPRPFTDGDIDFIASQYNRDGGCNVFPSGTPGPFNPRLVIFVDYPGLTKEMILSKIRSRIQRHMRGERTEELIFVARHRFTMQRMFEIQEKFGQLVDQWRFMDATFAPRIEFRDEARFWVRHYDSSFLNNSSKLGF
jgi:hypothetical protein